MTGDENGFSSGWRNFAAKKIADEITKIQPMVVPSDAIFHYDWSFGDIQIENQVIKDHKDEIIEYLKQKYPEEFV